VIIGKCMPQKANNVITYKDTSLVLKNNEQGFIDKNCCNDNEFTNVNGDGYNFAKVRIRSTRIPQIGDKFCLPPYAEVLTHNKGWKKIRDITYDDMVMQLDPDTKSVSFVHPIDIVSFPHEATEPMFRAKSKYMDIFCTTNHKICLESPSPSSNSAYLVKASDLLKMRPEEIRFCKTRSPLGQTTRCDDKAFFLGMFMSFGCIDMVRKCISFMNTKRAKIMKHLTTICNQNSWQMICDDDDIDVVCDDATYFMCKSSENDVFYPNWLYSSQETAKSFIDGFTLDETYLCSYSYNRATALQLLAILAGYSADIIHDHSSYYNVRLCKPEQLQYDDLVMSIEPYGVNSYVHCIEVPTHIFLVRMNGKAYFTGNSSLSGQKGTVGMLYRQEDMPFTREGIVPDIIMNPHAIPSRMTIAQLMECIMGKACCELGTFGDSTPFTNLSVEDISKVLEKAGLERYGNEILYNSRTGEQMETNIFIGPTYYQRLKHMVSDKVHCFAPGVDVLTDMGWVPIDSVTKEHKVATLVDGKNLVYEHPIDVLHFLDYKGKMYHISNSSIDLDVTINHRMWVSTCHTRQRVWSPYRFEEAGNILGKHVKYQKDADWDAPSFQFYLPEFNKTKQKKMNMNAWLTFFGIWIAEGWAHNGVTKAYTTGIAVHKPRVKAVLYDAITKLGYKYNVSGEHLTINNAQLHNYMATLSVGAPQKYLPDWVWQLSKEQARKLIHTMCLGDGLFKKNGGVIYNTSSVKLAGDFMRLCLHAGWSSTKSLHIQAGTQNIIRGKVVTNNFDVWRLSVIKGKNRPSVNHGHHQKQEERVYDYEGPVYCLQVPSEVFYVRRNGKCCWTGNSRASNGPILMLTRQPAEGRARDGGLRLGEMEVECNWAHGTMQFLKERFMECSDNYRVFVCKKCGMMANVNPEKNIYNCKACKNVTHFAQIRIPYACKLLMQEVQTMGISTKFLT